MERPLAAGRKVPESPMRLSAPPPVCTAMPTLKRRSPVSVWLLAPRIAKNEAKTSACLKPLADALLASAISSCACPEQNQATI